MGLYQKKKYILWGNLPKKKIDYAIMGPVCHVFMDILG
jgi:hypothetical protein